MAGHDVWGVSLFGQPEGQGIVCWNDYEDDDDDEDEGNLKSRKTPRGGGGQRESLAVRISKMKLRLALSIVLAMSSGFGCRQTTAGSGPKTADAQPIARSFSARGIVQQLDADGRTVLIKHEAISNYMAAMIMPFRASNPGELRNLSPGDEIDFRLLVSDSDSWIDKITRTGKREASETRSNVPAAVAASPKPGRHPLMDYNFTNELGQAVSLGQFDGQALAITF